MVVAHIFLESPVHAASCAQNALAKNVDCDIFKLVKTSISISFILVLSVDLCFQQLFCHLTAESVQPSWCVFVMVT